jgi:predicted  nucleic acid-binding Zn-ribbon protein
VTPELESLLILQDRDLKRASLETQLKAVPGEIARVEAAIAAQRAAIEAARAEMKDLELKKKLLETEIGSAEQQLAKYRTQQLGVKKNDEYQALGHQIETTQTKIGELEGRELEIMYSADEARRKFVGAEAALKATISDHEARIRTLREREVNLSATLKAAQADVAAARAPVAQPALRQYDRIASRNLPAVVPIRDAKCGGCHLKVSSEVESAARAKVGANGFPICDQCGRIVYWEG